MPNLTAQQANKLANEYLSIAAEVTAYRQSKFDDLSDQERKELADLAKGMRDLADYFFTASATLVMDDVSESLQTITSTTKDIAKSYKHLQNVQKAINVAGKLVVLGTAIATQNLPAIGGAIGGVISEWNT